MRILSTEVSAYVQTSGKAETPTVWATESPMLLLIARPGMFLSPNQTQWGPTGFPSLSEYGKTLPPDLRIRFFSISRSGLWSSERGFASHSPPSNFWRMIDLESPAFAHISVFFSELRMQTLTVVPLKLGLKSISHSSIYSWVLTKPFTTCFFEMPLKIESSFLFPESERMFKGRFFFT